MSCVIEYHDEDPLDDRLCLGVHAFGVNRLILGDGDRRWRTVDGTRRREHDLLDVGTVAAASTRCTVPSMLLCQYLAGSRIDSPTFLYAAKWTIDVTA